MSPFRNRDAKHRRLVDYVASFIQERFRHHVEILEADGYLPDLLVRSLTGAEWLVDTKTVLETNADTGSIAISVPAFQGQKDMRPIYVWPRSGDTDVQDWDRPDALVDASWHEMDLRKAGPYDGVAGNTDFFLFPANPSDTARQLFEMMQEDVIQVTQIELPVALQLTLDGRAVPHPPPLTPIGERQLAALDHLMFGPAHATDIGTTIHFRQAGGGIECGSRYQDRRERNQGHRPGGCCHQAPVDGWAVLDSLERRGRVVKDESKTWRLSPEIWTPRQVTA